MVINEVSRKKLPEQIGKFILFKTFVFAQEELSWRQRTFPSHVIHPVFFAPLK